MLVATKKHKPAEKKHMVSSMTASQHWPILLSYPYSGTCVPENHQPGRYTTLARTLLPQSDHCKARTQGELTAKLRITGCGSSL